MLTRCSFTVAAGGVETGWSSVEPFDELVASWAIGGVADCDVLVQGRRGEEETGWFVLARREAGGWVSVAGQEGAGVRVAVDTLVAASPLDAFRLRVAGEEAVRALAADTSSPPAAPRARATAVAVVPPVALSVEPLSQMAYAGAFPELDGGGASWCSPTSLTMVLRYHGVPAEVPEVARAVYDPVYGGCGNWSLNVAHAAARGLDAVVVRLPDLDAAARLLHAGLPLVVSIAAGPGALPGFPLAGGTTGHLVVLAGFTATGDPLVLDPAADRAERVTRTYPRAPFEQAWLGGSRGTAYVLSPAGAGLPSWR